MEETCSITARKKRPSSTTGVRDPIGLKFQVTDVRKPLLAVRRLVEKRNKVVLAGDDEESYVTSKATKVKIPVKKKGGAFVIEAHFVKRVFAGQA